MGLFGNIATATYSEGGVYLVPGVYRLEILSIISKRTRAQKDAFIVELKVLESTSTERLPGSTCAWMVMITPDSPALGNIKQFLATVIGCEMSQIDERVAEAAVAQQQPLKGHIVRAAAVNIMTKKNQPFTKVKWLPDSAGTAGAQAALAEETK